MPEVTITAAQLRQAADLIARRGMWTKWTYAVDEDGQTTDPHDIFACKWCAVGAVAHVALLSPWGAEKGLFQIDPAAEELTNVNDRRGKRAAVAELRRLADLEEARERAVSDA